MDIYRKRTDYRVVVEKMPVGTKVFNFLENVEYTIDENSPYVITGTVGEKWPISKETLLLTYNVEKSMDAIEKGIAVSVSVKDNGKEYQAYRLEKDSQIKTAQGNLLNGSKGDYVVSLKDDDSNRWIVNQQIFVRTYINVKEELKTLKIA